MLSDAGLDQIFRHARTYRAWRPEPVSDVLLQAVYDRAKMGPTTVNSSPLRVAFLRSREAKEKLRPALDAGNVDKTMTAPVTAVIAYDLAFYEHFPKLRSEEHTSELQSLMRISYAVFCLKKKKTNIHNHIYDKPITDGNED